VVADDDGVVVIPNSAANATLAAARQRVSKEEKKRAKLAAGELGLDLEAMRPKLQDLGLHYYDELHDVPEQDRL
jgi:4-hydroxy-4-methyl-2-oxoglutarate aldolase